MSALPPKPDPESAPLRSDVAPTMILEEGESPFSPQESLEKSASRTLEDWVRLLASRLGNRPWLWSTFGVLLLVASLGVGLTGVSADAIRVGALHAVGMHSQEWKVMGRMLKDPSPSWERPLVRRAICEDASRADVERQTWLGSLSPEVIVRLTEVTSSCSVVGK